MKIERPICPEDFGEPCVPPRPETLLERARRWLNDLKRAEGHPCLYAPAQRLTRGARGRTMTRRGLLIESLVVALAAGAAAPPKAMAFFRGGGGVVSGGVTLLTTETYQNPGSTDTNVEFRFGQAFPRGAVATTGYTFVLKDDLSNTLAMQYDQRSDYGAQTASTEASPSMRHLIFSTIVPSFGSARTISVYKQAGSYSPGTPVALSTITGSHNFIDKFGNSTYLAKDCNNNTIGSGQYQFVFNTYAAITFGPNGSGTGIPGGIRQLSSGAVQSTWVVSGAMTDIVGGAPYAHMYEEFYATSWSNGRVEFMPRLSNPWKNLSTPTPTLYWGDRSLYDGATLLRDYTQSFTFAPSAVDLTNVTFVSAQGTALSCTGTTTVTDLSGSFNAEMVSQYIYIESGTGLTPGNYLINTFTDANNVVVATSPGTGSAGVWRVGGGAIANPGTVQCGEAFVFSSTGTLPSGLTAGQLSFAMILNPYGPMLVTRSTVGQSSPDGYLTLASQGTGTHTMTRMCFVNSWQGVYLPADDVGNPFFLPARVATPYPNLTNAEKLYWMETGMVPGYQLTVPSGASFTSNYFVHGGGIGESYRVGSLALEVENISGGGFHNGIGMLADWTAAWWMNSTVKNWDLIRATALSENQAPMCNMLNSLTGYIPAFDNGPDKAGASYASIGAPFPNDFIYLSNPTSAGIAIPSSPSWMIENFTRYAWFGGIAFGLVSQGSMNHDPEWGSIPQYMFEGKPWFLDQVYRYANHGLIALPAGAYSGETDRTMTITGATPSTQYAKIVFSDQQPRSTAWGLCRNTAYAAVLGANTNPEQIYMWSVVRQNIQTFYLFANTYATTGFASMGFLSTNTSGESLFMSAYFGHAMSCMYGMIRQDESAVVAGASTLYMMNYGLRVLINLWTSWIDTYWAAVERCSNTINGTAPSPANAATFANSFSEVGINVGPGTYDGTISCDATGLISVTGWSGTDTIDEYYGNNDQWIAANPQAVSLFGTGISTPLYVVQWTAGSTPTCKLSNTIGGTAINPGMAGGALEFWIRPATVNSPAPPAAPYGYNTSPQGYVANAICAFSCGLTNGATELSLAAALTAANTRYGSLSGFNNPDWQQWLMDSTIRVT